jgi:hypothetical protein
MCMPKWISIVFFNLLLINLFYSNIKFDFSSLLINLCLECPAGWKIFKGACVKISNSNDKVSWEEARSTCLRDNSDLIELDFQRFFEYAELFSIFSKEKIDFYVSNNIFIYL